MAKIKVHLLTILRGVTHIEILLEDTSISPSTYFSINRWDKPFDQFEELDPTILSEASSIFSFDIEENPDAIVEEWNNYYQETLNEASIFGHNCGVSAQWFLTRFAKIPEPHFYSTPISLNQLALGIFLPSFIPCAVTLPGRIMSNAKFYIEARDNPDLATQYSYLFLSSCLAITAITCMASIAGIILASIFLTGGLSIGVIALSAILGAASAIGFFACINSIASKNLSIEYSNQKPTKTIPTEAKPLIDKLRKSRIVRFQDIQEQEPTDTARQRYTHRFHQDAKTDKPAAFTPFQGRGYKLGTF